MDMESVLLLSVLLFFIIYFAITLAIKPLLNEQVKTIIDEQDFGLVKLRDISVLSSTELEEVIKLYQKKGVKKEEYEEYRRYAKILYDLKEMDYFTYKEYLSRMNKLKKHFKIESYL
ncbi:hypothetical protein GCM10008905_00820 [Clostridium malenominatum]|uniref:Uncharacterized protein n=1 Tax=Clostridium malenominatum TaxID=1539 RepID=A0ABN1IKY0_9CLOT